MRHVLLQKSNLRLYPMITLSQFISVEFEISTNATINIVLLWLMRLCSLVGVHRRFGDKYLNFVIANSVFCEFEFVN